MRTKTCILIFSCLWLNCSNEKLSRIQFSQDYNFQYIWYIQSRLGGGTEKIIYNVVAFPLENFITFNQTHPNGTKLIYHIDFENNFKSFLTGYPDTIWIDFLQSKEITIDNESFDVYKYRTTPWEDCLELDNDSLHCSTTLFLTREFGLISDINRELISINKLKYPIHNLLEKLKLEKSFYKHGKK